VSGVVSDTANFYLLLLLGLVSLLSSFRGRELPNEAVGLIVWERKGGTIIIFSSCLFYLPFVSSTALGRALDGIWFLF